MTTSDGAMFHNRLRCIGARYTVASTYAKTNVDAQPGALIDSGDLEIALTGGRDVV
jgi:hypothetical protein